MQASVQASPKASLTQGAVVREVQLKDLQFLPPILNQLTEVGDVGQEKLETFYHTMSANPLHQIYVVEFEGVVIGCATLLKEPKIIHNCSAVGHIEDVVVDKAYRRRGFGKMLITHLIHEAQKGGCYKVILDSSSDVSTFYQKCGMGPKQQCMALYFK